MHSSKIKEMRFGLHSETVRLHYDYIGFSWRADGRRKKHIGSVVVTMMEYVAHSFVYRQDDQPHGPSLVMLGATNILLFRSSERGL